MMQDAGVPQEQRYLLYQEASSHATRLDGLVIIEINGVKATRFKHLIGADPRFILSMRTWGEEGVIKVGKGCKSKLGNRGMEVMFIGYAIDHPWDTYRMYTPKTQMIHNTCDV